MFILLIYFLILLSFSLKKRSVTIFFILLQIVSLTGTLFIGLDYPLKSPFSFFNLFITIILLTLIILPWKNVNDIKIISTTNERKIDRLTRFLLIINVFVFCVFAVTAYFVNTFVSDINEFKYVEGTSIDFYYSMPTIVKPLILSNHLYPLSYFLIPLHFYYLSQKRIKLSLLCLFFSLNSVLYGMTFFSRATYIHYLLIYLGMFFILYKTISPKHMSAIKKIFAIILTIATISFVSITISRFSNDNLYEKNIPANSPIQDPPLYSTFDYLSQWFPNSMYVLDSYNDRTFNGQISFQPILELLGRYKIIDYNTKEYTQLRRELWPKHYYTFNGYAAYTVYDFGYFLAILFSLFYFYFVSRKCSSHNGVIAFHKLLIIVLLIQLPLFAIFYSNSAVIIFASIYLIPILLYLRTRL